MRERTRLLTGERNALATGLKSPFRLYSGEFAGITVDPSVQSPWRLTAVTTPAASKNRLRLHSADRHTSDFLQVAPIETASARMIRVSSAFFPEALPIGR